jgi:protein-disulfide isomerase
MAPSITRRKLLAAGGIGLSGVAGGYFLLGQIAGPSTPECSVSPPADLDAPTLGSQKSQVTVAEYVDFSCPHCRDYTLNVFLPIYREFVTSGVARYVHHDFPLPVDKWSRPAASAAREVQRLGGDQAFFAYSIAMFRNQDRYSYDLFGKLANSLKADIDGEKVRNAAKKGAYCKLLNSQIEQASDRGVSATPTVFVNEKKLEAPTAEQLRDAIKKAQ